MQIELDTYLKTFIQRSPRYGIKQKNGSWRTKQKSLSDTAINAHLRQQYCVGVLGQWYPKYAILDFDDVNKEHVEEIRQRLELSEKNSMLFTSESENSYHLLFRPHYRNKPPTIRLLNDIFRSYSHEFEIYPQAKRFVRLPFGYSQRPFDYSYFTLSNWQDYLKFFNKLDNYDLSTLNHQTVFNFESTGLVDAQGNQISSTLQEGQYLFENGLQMPSSRNDSQFAVIYYLWRNNVTDAICRELVYKWINDKHNGYSKDIIHHPKSVKAEIERQVNCVYSKYELGYTYPDTTHNSYNGFITKHDIPQIVKYAGGNLPRMKFLFQIIRYSYPRRYQNGMQVHRDKLVSWASERTYLKYLAEFESKGLLTRESSYLVDAYAKKIKLKWDHKNDNDAILYDARSLNTLEDTLKLVIKPREFRQILLSTGVKSQQSTNIVKNIYD